MSIDTKGIATGTWGLDLCFLRGFFFILDQDAAFAYTPRAALSLVSI